jgi:hypothetical protein
MPVPRSRFQPDRISFLQNTVAELANPSVIDDEAWYSNCRKQLEDVVADAGFMGYPRTSRLGRAVYHAMPLARQSKNVEQLTTLSKALSKLLSACESTTEAEQLDTAETLASLQKSFSVDASELLAPLHAYVPSGTTPQNASANMAASTGGEHSDSSIYSSSILDSMDQCDVEESWIVSQLASVAEDIAAGSDKGKPAHHLMNVLRGHRFLRAIDRVGVVGLVRKSNQLIVVDSCISQRARDFHGENPMQKGYSCFVNPVGSLSKMKPSVLRIFGDSEQVMKSFADQGQPAQRSISHIVDTGMRSGMCMAIGRGQLVQGFLFMNSLQPDIFKEIRTRFAPLLSLLSVSGTVALDAAGFRPDDYDTDFVSHLPATATVFDPATFKSMVESTVVLNTGMEIDLQVVTKEIPTFLYLPRTIVSLCADLIEQTYAIRNQQEIVWTAQVRGERVSLEFDCPIVERSGVTSQTRTRIIERCANRFAECPLSVDRVKDRIRIQFPVEPVFDRCESNAYSVAF